MRNHKKAKHEGLLFYCDKCDFRYADKTSLKEHLKTKHEGYLYQCAECDFNADRIQN